MARTNPISKEDREIAKRLRWIREATLASRSAFCRSLGLDYLRFSSYELGRVPLPFSVGDAVCKAEGVSQLWLATGKDDWHFHHPIPSELLAKIPPRATFRDAVNGVLNAHLQLRRAEASVNLNTRRLRLMAESDLNAPKIGLNDVAALVTLPPVRNWQELRKRLIQATEPSGEMTALAKWLDVPLASVSRWLSGDREPGGDYALRMLKWVEDRERATK